MKLVKIFGFMLLILGMQLIISAQMLMHSKTQNLSNLITGKIDSLKWTAYAMNFDQTALHYRSDKLPARNIIECDLNYSLVNKADTSIYFFTFYKGNSTDIYVPDLGYYNGIGLDSISGNIFPVYNLFQLRWTVNVDSCKSFFEESERNFVKYLKNYNGNLSPWLREEAIKRKVISN